MSSTRLRYDSLKVSARFDAVSVLPSPGTALPIMMTFTPLPFWASCSTAAMRCTCRRMTPSTPKVSCSSTTPGHGPDPSGTPSTPRSPGVPPGPVGIETSLSTARCRSVMRALPARGSRSVLAMLAEEPGAVDPLVRAVRGGVETRRDV